MECTLTNFRRSFGQAAVQRAVRTTNPAVPNISALVLYRIRLHLWILCRYSNICVAILQNHSVYVWGLFEVLGGCDRSV